MQNLFFLGIILVGKEKIQNKNTKTIQKQKKIKASHFAAETEGRSMEASPAGPRGGRRGPQLPQGHSREEPPKKKKKKRLAGAQTADVAKKGRGQVFSAVESSENQNKNTCSLLKPHKRHQQNVLRSLEGFSDIFYFIVYFKVVFKTKHTEKQSLETDWLCVHRNTNTTRYVLVGLL